MNIADLIYKINPGLPTTTKISNLNDQIITTFGQVEEAQFDKNELDSLYTDLGIARKFLRNVALGNILSTYTGWSSLSTQTGYNIWKFTPASYGYNALNAIYWNGGLLNNMGLATSESITTFADVIYDGGVLGWQNNTTEAGVGITANAFNLLLSTTDYQYFASTSAFNGIALTLPHRGSGYTLVVQYWAGSNWVAMTPATNGLIDNTNNLSGSGAITWTTTTGWTTDSISGITGQYIVRISSTTAPTTIATCSYAIPSASVIALLQLSSAEVIAGQWAFCSYNGNIYVTIPNAGNAPSEGNTFITSTSTSTNLQNFFIYNNIMSANYANSAYVASIVPRVFTGTQPSGHLLPTPARIGDIFIDTGDNIIYIANGTSSYANWIRIN